MLRIGLIGGLRLQVDGADVPSPDSRRARTLLAWLALHPGRHGRSQVAGALRPDVPEEDARRSLRQATWLAGRALGDGAGHALIATRAEVGLDPDAVSVDVDELRERASAGDLDAARALRTRPLLPEIDEEWAIAARDELRAEVAEIAARQAAAAEAAGDVDAAVRWVRERAAADPLSELAQTEHMRLLNESGDRAAALRVADALRRRLSEELGVNPSPETRAAIEAVLTSDDRPSRPRPRPSAPQPAPARAPAGDGSSALPSPLATIAGDPLVGREEPLGRVERAWETVKEGRPGIVVLSGEPGIGKTRLAAEVAAEVTRAGGAVLFGRCAEEPLASYQPFAEALERGVDDGALAIDSLPGVHVAELVRMLPRLARDGLPAVPPDSDPELARHRMFEAVRAALPTAGERPALLVLDDVQWADAGGLALLHHLAARLSGERLLIVLTFRDATGGHALPRLLTALRRSVWVEHVPLEPLDPGAVAQLMPDPAQAELLHRRTGGNPLFVVETLRSAGSGDELPLALRELIEQRLAVLGPEALSVVRAAAVAGLEFDLRDLRPVCDLDDDELVGALDRALDARLIREDAGAPGRYGFAHALVADAAYAGMSGARRARLHCRLGESLADRAAPAGAVAHHLLAAAPVADGELTLTWVERAADAAVAALAYEDAAALLRRALPQADAPARRAALLARLGDALDRAGRRAEAREAFAEAAACARSEGDGAALAAAALGFKGLVVTVTTPDPEAVGLLEEALAAVGGDDPALRARLQAALALESYYDDVDRARRLAAEAVRQARAARDPATLAHTLSARHLALWDPDHVHDRIGVATEMARVARAAGDRVALLQARNWRIVDLFDLGQIDAVIDEIDAYEAEADALGVPRLGWYVPLWRAAIAILRGEWEPAEELSRRAAERGVAAGDPNAAPYRSIQATGLLLEQERYDEIDIESIREQAIASPTGRGAWIGWLAWIYDETGRRDDAQRWFDELAADDFAKVPRDANWHAMCDAAEATARLGTPEQVRAVHAILRPYERLVPVMGRGIASVGPVAYYLGRLAAAAGDAAAAARHYEWALGWCERVGAVPRAAMCRARLDELGTAARPG